MMVGVQTFVDDDLGYQRWLEMYPDLYVLNAERVPRPSYLVLHRVTCCTISGARLEVPSGPRTTSRCAVRERTSKPLRDITSAGRLEPAGCCRRTRSPAPSPR
jgi:hypothetical protein